jgi:tRNA 2-thiocytidine biosynthesis protein TtcA
LLVERFAHNRYNITVARPESSMNALAAHSTDANKLAKRLRRQVGQAIADYNMIEDGDRIMVCLSGGKDSYTLLDILRQLQAKAPVRFELVAVHLDQKQPDYDATILPAYLRSIGMPFQIIEQDTYSVVKRVVPEGKTMCGLCSRLRRGALYAHAERAGFTRLALGIIATTSSRRCSSTCSIIRL